HPSAVTTTPGLRLRGTVVVGRTRNSDEEQGGGDDRASHTRAYDMAASGVEGAVVAARRGFQGSVWWRRPRRPALCQAESKSLRGPGPARAPATTLNPLGDTHLRGAVLIRLVA